MSALRTRPEENSLESVPRSQWVNWEDGAKEGCSAGSRYCHLSLSTGSQQLPRGRVAVGITSTASAVRSLSSLHYIIVTGMSIFGPILSLGGQGQGQAPTVPSGCMCLLHRVPNRHTQEWLSLSFGQFIPSSEQSWKACCLDCLHQKYSGY